MAAEIYSCLDPRGHTPEKLKTPLMAPRLADLNGKNVLVVMHEMDPNVMLEVRKELPRQVPDINIVWWNVREDGDPRVKEIPKEPKLDAAIVGVGF